VLVTWARRHKVANTDALDVAAHRLERPRVVTE